MMNRAKKQIVCFGEVLWDLLPAGKQPGGAPMNVAYHLHKLGLQSTMISSVGADAAGRELLDFLSGIGLSLDYVQQHPTQVTSEVHARIGADNEVSYEILYPVAWDFIEWEDRHQALISEADAFIFGSLGSRNEASRTALMKMLDYAKYRVFDVNIRAPHYSKDFIIQLMERCELLKVNQAELAMIAAWFDPNCVEELAQLNLLFERFPIQEVLVTKGGTGAAYHSRTLTYQYPAYAVKVQDTVGSGDSFLAAFLSMRLYDKPLEQTLDYAAAMGAFITSQSGACPAYDKFELDRFIWKRNWASGISPVHP